MVTIEYLIDPVRVSEFRSLMLTESRRSRLLHGALSWELLHDINEPGRFLEVIVDECSTIHLRRFYRVTATDVALRDCKLAFHCWEMPPRVTRCVMGSTVRSSLEGAPSRCIVGEGGSQDLFNGQSRVDLPNNRRISDFTYISVWWLQLKVLDTKFTPNGACQTIFSARRKNIFGDKFGLAGR